MAQDRRDDIERLFCQYGRGVGSFILARVGDPELAEEITARVFLKVVRFIDQRRGPEAGWLYAIVQNEITRHFRDRQRFVRPPTDLADPGATPCDQALCGETRSRLQAALAQLPPEQQQLVYLKFFQQMRNLDIAGATGMTASNVGVVIHRALKQLRRLMEPASVSEEIPRAATESEAIREHPAG